ncbi:sugar ABC transporter permease [Kutzneria buriramensis]|uniref:Xylose transport system permease protein XylH n=1 Tax=Kutzneria buriramensis TaxID=1045776 RepID=A0A3E0HZX3_9PSEU|nr:ABC transporter permease [Kutzneria buriramensis]REH51860.1 D-xylose transport system permease protein [Kutzneria buriramensis]
MTDTPAAAPPSDPKPSSDTPAEAVKTADKQDAAIADFGIDTTSRSTGQALRDYVDRVRGGELGSLPALAGLIVLVIVFAVASDTFLTMNNLSNLLAQAAGITIIAMGLVFVLLLGEIDLSAGTASGVAASVMALHLVKAGNLQGGMGDTVYYAFIVGGVLAIGVAVWQRIWLGAALSAVAVLLLLSGVPANPWVEMLLAICVGSVIGCLTGVLISKVGIPSFVVTLALFLAWGGVILKLIGDGGTLSISNDPVLFGVANNNLNILGSWILFLIFAGGYAAVVLSRHAGRVRRGLVAQPTVLIMAKVGAVVVLGAAATYLLTLNRSPNPDRITIEGVPYVVPIVLVLLVIGTFVLDRTKYGRHIYAVGGSAEAARRAGINVPKIRMSVFVIASTVSAVGAIVYSSKVGSVDPNAGGGNTLLFAVGAAVIGGTSLFGGKGRLSNAIIGGFVITIVSNGLGLIGAPAAVVSIVTGAVLLLAASVDALSRRRAKATGH